MINRFPNALIRLSIKKTKPWRFVSLKAAEHLNHMSAMKKTISVVCFLKVVIITNLFAQPSRNIAIPELYAQQFPVESKKYLQFTNPSTESAGSAFNLWMAVKKSYRKGLNADSLFTVYKDLRQIEYLKKLEFMRQNPGTYASLYYFHQQVLNSSLFTPDSLRSIFTNFSKELQHTPLGQNILQSINRKGQLLLNKEMPLFSFKTESGQEVSLSSFRDQRYVLICFWASWCGPCIRSIPLLKKLEEQYRTKGLQIISISTDNEAGQWQAALKKYSMQWLQTCDLPVYVNESLRTLYEIHYVPQYFLIDKKGKLVYQSILMNDDDSYTELQNTLHQAMFPKQN